MTKNEIKNLENKLKKKTGEDKLPKDELGKASNSSKFNSSQFIKLANELKKILFDDEQFVPSG